MSERPKTWLVDFDSDAVRDFEEVRSPRERRAVFNAVQKLKDLGPRLPAPHMKSLKGEVDLFELRPRQGACAARLIYARAGRRFVVLAVTPDKEGMARAVSMARTRLTGHRRGF